MITSYYIVCAQGKHTCEWLGLQHFPAFSPVTDIDKHLLQRYHNQVPWLLCVVHTTQSLSELVADRGWEMLISCL